MSDATLRLRNHRTRKGQSLAELEFEVCDEAEATFLALRRLYAVALNYLPAEDNEAYAASEQANAALAKAGDAEALKANRESHAYMGRPMNLVPR